MYFGFQLMEFCHTIGYHFDFILLKHVFVMFIVSLLSCDIIY